MTDGGVVSTGSLLTPVDWGYSSPHFISKDFLHVDNSYDIEDEDDDELDSYYIDLPPVDMTERLKEVNRALAEDVTPVEGGRITKLRFRDIIADFKSPRESVIASDSDDGYGDSSDIMFDAEEENDILCPTPTVSKIGSDQTSQINLLQNHNQFNQPSVILPMNNDESKNSHINETIKFNNNFNVASTCSSVTKNNVVEGTKPIIKLDVDFEKDVIAEEIPEIVEEEPLSECMNDSSLDDVFLTDSSIPETNKKEDDDKLFAKSNGRFSKCYKKSELELFESDIDEEIEEFNQDFFLRGDSEEEVSPKVKGYSELDDSTTMLGTKVKHKNIVENNIDIIPKVMDSIMIDISHTNLLPKLYSSESPSTESKQNVNVHDGISNNIKKSKKVTTTKSSSSSIKNNNKLQENRLSSSQPVPNIKSTLLTPSMYQPLRNTKGSTLPTSSMRTSRSKTVYSNAKKFNLTNPIQSTRGYTDVKGSSLPKRSSKFNDNMPMKAIHSHSMIPDPKMLSSYDRSFPGPMMHGVRKAASTSDLRRGGIEEHKKLNDDIYESWLQDKKRTMTMIKREEEEAKIVEQVQAAAKLQERRQMAEEAFQQWLRRKREQLRAEKKLRSERRKLDQHSSYARTRSQCDDAYAEWCKRKQEEMVHRRVNGVNVRSRSLERTWIQEKTRKLYNAYLSKH